MRFAPDGRALFDGDGLLITAAGANGVRKVLDAGAFDAVTQRHPEVPVTHWPGRIIAPGFIDTHLHYPQTDSIGVPAAALLPWLEQHIFPVEARFADPAHADEVAAFFCDELARHGVTTALVFATSHPGSVNAFFGQAERRRLRMICGKVLQDRHSPDGIRDETEQSLLDTEALIQCWHGRARLGYAITPRFAPSCSPDQLAGAGELAKRHPGTWIHSHVAENRDEVRWVHQLFPQARSYLDVYQRFGLLRERAVYAHCIHLDDTDRQRMHETGAAAAVCPTSNLFLGSGFFDFDAAQRLGMRHALASDVGAGTSFSPFQTMLAAYCTGREGRTKPGLSLAPSRLWWLHTAGAAQALGLEGMVGSLQAGTEADFIILDPKATPLLARKVAQVENLEELLFALIALGDDRVVERVVVA